ncbi:putative transcription regulator Homeodomain-LIKE family [Helianthus annuus]|uniref:Myb/SANT-like domain-containing protein n=1 Tax=Helianthus annuus TaxID=4232 RepID=A0A251VAU4_HELAN|nr:uncharacterized protein LOC110930335 [Helianthus annuus]XP_022029326.1 uncharacterized protein LOC110930335 [Helianthus annuus]KAF5815703.1 putative Myb/SANT-like domain-containing protein [Helianthus annuus]KAJ0602222.1 putative transcription regulator Homeodomain-LIKE family [Helianthus annuus]KAJ0609142.1 putative transcription regulator Homeodomain-LIKE family [Helianthus annuus]KAJ0769208.1 putative transcription regulator Homeodomain-LIKE family [Helianthus annuus]KAJ0937033.1 putati
MGSQIPNGNDRSRTYWTPTMERYFVDLMLEHMQKGNRVGHTFNKQAWNDMLAVFNAKFGSQYDKDVLKSRYTNLWKQFNDIKSMLGQVGFSWDDARNMVVADDYVWDAYIKAHPDARPYKIKSVQNFSDLCLIYGYTTADGRYSRSSHDVDIDDEVTGVNSGDGVGTPTPSTTERLRTEWTLAMDQFFTELLLRQQEKGNKLDSNINSYTKEAWTEMLNSFTEKFGPHHTKRVLRHRYKKLFKYYTDITVLLKQDGFSWDAKQQKIVANDDVWDAYIKAHPQSRSYRAKSMPNYQDLESIFGSATVDKSQFNNNLDEDIVPKAGSDRSRTHWTPPMDSYLIELLLDQVSRGNRNGQTFMAQAWINMVKSFNDNFTSNHDKDVLKNRYKHLKKQYNDINALLTETGFSWDDEREMVTAEDHVWDAYIEAHPDSRSYRVKTVPNYHKLCIVYGQNITEKLEIPIGGNSQILPNESGAIDKRKRVKKTPLGLERSGKVQKSQSDDIKEAFTDMANVVSKLVNGKTDRNYSPIEKAVDALQAIPDIDDDLLLDGCDILEDEKKAKTFLALDASLRKKWLLRKLGR